MTTRDQETVYGREHFRANYPDGVQLHYWNRCRNRLIGELVREHAGAVKVLDVGCGRGVVVAFLRSAGFDAWGCELGHPDPITAEIAPYIETGRDVLEARCRRQARCVLVLDVLEHLPEPVSFLRQIVTELVELEHVIVTVPARAEIWSEWDTAFDHYRRYDREGLGELLASAGLEVVDSGYFFHALYVAARVINALPIRRATTMRAPRTALSRFAHRVIGGALSLERRLLPASLPGSSLYAVARVRRNRG